MMVYYIIIGGAITYMIGFLIGKYYMMKRKKELLGEKYAVWKYSKW